MQAVRLLLLPHLLFLPLRRAPVPLRTARLFSRDNSTLDAAALSPACWTAYSTF
jgi:hypothetical protein